MDYEKKYKEALEIAKKLDEDGCHVLRDVFPELKRNEYESTRKRIIALVNAHGQGKFKESMLAWLEKLKVFTEHGNGLYHFANSEFTYVGNPTWDNTCLLEKQGEKNPFDYENATIMPKDFAPKVEQKPIWGEEDEQIVHNIRMFIEKYAFSQSAVDVNGDLCEKIYIDADNWLKVIKQRIGG